MSKQGVIDVLVLLKQVEAERDEAREANAREAQRGDGLSAALINLNIDLEEARDEAGRLREKIAIYEKTHDDILSGKEWPEDAS